MINSRCLVLFAVMTALGPAARAEDGEDYPSETLAGAPDEGFESLPIDLRDAARSAPTPSTITDLVEAQRGSDERAKRQTVRALGTRGNVAAIPYVGGMLLRLDESRLTRIDAARALGRIGEARVGAFLSQALSDPDIEVRVAAVCALGEAAPPGAETLLEVALRGDKSWWVRYSAATALGATRHRFAVDALARAAREDVKPQVRLHAAIALGEIGGKRAAALLRGAWTLERDGQVRRSIIISLRRLAGQTLPSLAKN